MRAAVDSSPAGGRGANHDGEPRHAACPPRAPPAKVSSERLPLSPPSPPSPSSLSPVYEESLSLPSAGACTAWRHLACSATRLAAWRSCAAAAMSKTQETSQAL